MSHTMLDKVQGHPFFLVTNDVNDAAVNAFIKSDYQWLSLPYQLKQLCRRSSGSCRIAITAAVWAKGQNYILLQDQVRNLLRHSLQSRFRDDEPGNEDDNWFECVQQLQWIRRRKDPSILAPLIVETIHSAMKEHVEEIIGGEFEDDTFLPGIQEWNQEVVIPWVQSLVGGDHDDWSVWCQSHIVECFVQCRTSEIFSLIAEYPDSHPAVCELSHCLERATKLYPYFAQALQESLIQRLLHPGANTSQILEVYINTIKVLRHIDPSDRLIVKVAEPVRTYLRRRTDTVRCIITNLTDQEAELYQELQRPNAKPLQETKLTDDDDDDYYDEDDEEDEEEEPDMTWRPPPPVRKQRTTFFDPSIGRKSNTSSSEQQLDILSILVSIYGSKELFVDEYRTMLADKLLTKTPDNNTDSEIHTLELLKLRFGEDSMRHCEIMIKDTDDSKRLMANIQSSLSTNIVDASVISHIFWPSISSSTFQHHPRIQQNILDPFSTEYGQLKNPRRLVWYNQLGTVELALQTEDDDAPPKSITCTPLLATLISYFEDQPVWKVADLAEKVGMPVTTIQKRLIFWVHRQVLTVDATATTYSLTSSQNWSRRSTNTADDGDEHDDENEHPTFQYAEEEANDVFCSYIVGMLQRYKELPLYRIHDMLKLFCNNNDGAAVSYNKTQRQLSQLLNGMQKVECRPDGMYKLVEK